MVFTDYNTKFLDEDGVNHLIKELKEYMSGLATGNVDLSAYVTKEELQAKLDALDINIDLSSYATKEELEKAISGIDLSSYALKTDIPSLDGYATTEYVDNAIANIPTNDGASDLTNYYTKEEVYNKEEVDNLIPSVDGLATTEYVNNAVSNIPATDLTGYATEEYVSTAINSIPSTDLSNYYNKEETYSKTEVDELMANSGSSDSGSSSSGGNVLDVYSTEETIIGTWIDGSPIYRKVVEYGKLGSVSDGNYNKISINFTDAFGEILRTTALLRYSTSTRLIVDGGWQNVLLSPSTTHSTYTTQIEQNKVTFIGTGAKQISIYYGKSWGSYSGTFIFEYTKAS